MGGNVVSVCIVRAECSPLMKGGYSSLAVIGGTKRALMLVNFWQGHSWAPVGSAWSLCSGWILRIAEWGCNHICLWACLCYGPPMGCPSHLSPNPHFTFTRSSPCISLCYHALGKHKILLHLQCLLWNIVLPRHCCNVTFLGEVHRIVYVEKATLVSRVDPAPSERALCIVWGVG